MSEWKVVGMERSWIGDPGLPAKPVWVKHVAPGVAETQGSGPYVTGTGRPDEVTYRLRLDKRGPIYDLGFIAEQNAHHDVATATVTVRYADGEDGVAAEMLDLRFSPEMDASPRIEPSILAIDYLRDHKPPLLWSTP